MESQSRISAMTAGLPPSTASRRRRSAESTARGSPPNPSSRRFRPIDPIPGRAFRAETPAFRSAQRTCCRLSQGGSQKVEHLGGADGNLSVGPCKAVRCHPCQTEALQAAKEGRGGRLRKQPAREARKEVAASAPGKDGAPMEAKVSGAARGDPGERSL